jgi:hypothetical protein
VDVQDSGFCVERQWNGMDRRTQVMLWSQVRRPVPKSPIYYYAFYILSYILGKLREKITQEAGCRLPKCIKQRTVV